MEVTVYLDILFLFNFIVCESLLFWVREMSQVKEKKRYLILAGIMGSIGATLYVMCDQRIHLQGWMQTIYTAGAIFIIMVILRIAFWHAEKEERKRIFLYFFVACFLLVGILAFGYRKETGLSIGVVMIKSCIFLLTIPLARVAQSHYQFQTTKLYPFVLRKNGIEQQGMGLLDTGNGLCHPRTREPVVVAPHTFLRPFFDETEYERQEKLLCFSEVSLSDAEKIVWIPYHTIGKDSGLLPGIYFESLLVDNNGTQKENQPILVAFCKEKVSVKDEYQMILHCDCV